MHGKLTLLASVVGVVGGLVGQDVAAEQAGPDEARENEIPSAEEVLANPLDDDAYEDTVRCISAARYRRIEIVGNAALAFHSRSGDVWLNILPRRCPGLRSGMILSIEQRNYRVCARDRFRGLPRAALDLATPICALGRFQHVTPERLEAMREALAAQGRNKTVAKTKKSAQDANPTEIK